MKTPLDNDRMWSPTSLRMANLRQ